MTKRLTADLSTGTDTLMRVVGLAKKKGIQIVSLSVEDIGKDSFNMKLQYNEKENCNFENSVYNIEGVYNINQF